jgi:Double-GTPase 2
VKARLYCPYCYSPFLLREIKFRCTGRMSRTGQRCDPEIDETLRGRTGFGGALPPVFDADARPSAAQCPRCGKESTTRICPVCHSALPVHFGKVSSRLIALVGAKETGKTVFMTVLVHELMNRVGRRFDAAMSGADDSTRERFSSGYEGPLYRERRLLGATATAASSGREPLVFRLTTEERRLIGAAVPRHTLLSFFDTAGEDLTSKQSVEENVRYLSAADGIVLLLDPLQMRGARDLAKPGTRMPAAGAAADEPAHVLERITDLVMTVDGGPRKKISKPLAIAFTKLDTLNHDLKETSPLRRPAPQSPFFDETDSEEVHAEILRLLSRWDGTRIDQIASKHYQRYRYFGLSALGDTPTEDNKVSQRGIQPYRVADPLLWELGGFGAIKVKKGS